jgi:ElaB/YqjD/DUF883 family membrane-anchored ribosome-binding protein
MAAGPTRARDVVPSIARRDVRLLAIIRNLHLTPREIDMTAARFERSRDALVKDFSDVLVEAETLLKQAAKESGEKASDLRTQVEAKLRSAKLRLMDLQDDAIDSAKAAARVTDDYVRDNPWQAIGVAAAIGFLVGLVISRR